MLDHPRSPFVYEKFLQISYRSSVYFSKYRDSKILQIWLKKPIQASKIMFLGSFDPKHYY